jgi:hypothetical protein
MTRKAEDLNCAANQRSGAGNKLYDITNVCLSATFPMNWIWTSVSLSTAYKPPKTTQEPHGKNDGGPLRVGKLRPGSVAIPTASSQLWRLASRPPSMRRQRSECSKSHASAPSRSEQYGMIGDGLSHTRNHLSSLIHLVAFDTGYTARHRCPRARMSLGLVPLCDVKPSSPS